MPLPGKIIKEFSKAGDLQLFRLETLHEFQCLRCQAQKKSKLVAVPGGDWSKPLCNGCCGLLCRRRDERRYGHKHRERDKKQRLFLQATGSKR
jgi:hypothetical protein